MKNNHSGWDMNLGHGEQARQKRAYLKAEAILKFLTESNDNLDTMIMCGNDIQLTTTDQSIYEAVASVEDKSRINLNKLAKLLEVVEINSYSSVFGRERSILKDKRAAEIREKASKIL